MGGGGFVVFLACRVMLIALTGPVTRRPRRSGLSLVMTARFPCPVVPRSSSASWIVRERPCRARRVDFDEFDLGGGRSRRRRIEGAYALGSAGEVLTAAAGVPAGDPWVAAVCRALERERACAGEPRYRRSRLWVMPGMGEVFHVTAVANRDSISRHGLDWHRMGAAPGSPGVQSRSLRRCLSATAVTRRASSRQWPARPAMCGRSALRACGLRTARTAGSSLPSRSGPDRLRLADRDVPPPCAEDHPQRHGPSAAYQSTLTIRRADGSVTSWPGGPQSPGTGTPSPTDCYLWSPAG